MQVQVSTVHLSGCYNGQVTNYVKQNAESSCKWNFLMTDLTEYGIFISFVVGAVEIDGKWEKPALAEPYNL